MKKEGKLFRKKNWGKNLRQILGRYQQLGKPAFSYFPTTAVKKKDLSRAGVS